MNEKQIGDLADEIRSRWIEWETDAAMLSTTEQDSRAGEQFLHNRLVDAIRSATGKCVHGHNIKDCPICSGLQGRRCKKCQSLMIHTRLGGYRCNRGCQ